MYFPADPSIAFGEPGVIYPGAGQHGYFPDQGAIVGDSYAMPMGPYGGQGMFGMGLFAGPGGPPSQRGFRVVGGIDLTFVQPFFENNDALFVTTSDGVTFQSISGREFDYDAEFAPRIWIKGELQNGGGLRIAYWQFDHDANNVAADAPANGFGAVSPVSFFRNAIPNVDISARAPGERLSASSWLDMCAFDIEGVKDARLENWRLVVSGGVRYAEIEQRYRAQMTNNGVLAGEIDLRRKQDGFGPTIAVLAERPLPLAFTLFTDARVALLYGDASANLSAGEDLDLANPFRTSLAISRDDLLFVAESRLGFLWGPRMFNQWQPFLGLALEGQYWEGAGSASSEDGSLGLFGLNLMLGASW
jgi:hypothetical protein